MNTADRRQHTMMTMRDTKTIMAMTVTMEEVENLTTEIDEVSATF